MSIHATDPDLRARLLRNRRGATSLRWLTALLDADVEVHGQIVVCPDLNDGAALDDTLLGILDRFPRLATVGVVPLGVSAHTTEPDLRPHSAAEAESVLDVGRHVAAPLSRRCSGVASCSQPTSTTSWRAGRSLVDDDYEGFPQHENGIGMARTFAGGGRARDRRPRLIGRASTRTGRAGFFAWVDGAPADGLPSATNGRRPDRRCASSTVTGARRAHRRVRRSRCSIRCSGTRATVARSSVRIRAGRRTASSAATSRSPASSPAPTWPGRSRTRPSTHRYLLPDVVLSDGRFLDGLTPADLPRPVEIVPTDGASLVEALR